METAVANFQKMPADTTGKWHTRTHKRHDKFRITFMNFKSENTILQIIFNVHFYNTFTTYNHCSLPNLKLENTKKQRFKALNGL